LLDLLDPDLRIVLLTARPERVHHLTYTWLRRYRIRWDLLLMRPWGDYEMARDFKQASVWDLRNYGFQLRLAIEDDRRNVAMFRSEGVPCMYFHSGCYDCPGPGAPESGMRRRRPGTRGHVVAFQAWQG